MILGKTGFKIIGSINNPRTTFSEDNKVHDNTDQNIANDEFISEENCEKICDGIVCERICDGIGCEVFICDGILCDTICEAIYCGGVTCEAICENICDGIYGGVHG